MADFAPIENRDAYQVIRGYVYQVDLTIERWLQLSPGQVLELECGEDIDRVAGALSSEERDRLLEQIKCHKDRLTLRSKDALKTLACATASLRNNPDISLTFRYTSNAEITVERPAVFDQRIPAIEMWEKIRTGQLDKAEQEQAAEKLRSFLANATKPQNVSSDVWQGFTDFIATETSTGFLGFIKAFEWSTGCTEALAMQPIIQGILVDTNRAANTQEAETKYQRLFLHVFKLLCQEGTKRLTLLELEEQLALPALNVEDQEKLVYIQGILTSLEKRVSFLEQATVSNKQSFEAMRPLVEELATEHGLDVENIQYTSVEPIIDVPPQVQQVSRRKETVSGVKDELDAHTWIALTGTVGSGKTQLAILLAQETSVCKAWISLRDKKKMSACSYLDRSMDVIAGYPICATGKERYQIAVQSLNSGDLIVLDDTPPLQENHDLSERLLLMLEQCASRNVKVISTSTFPLGGDFSTCAGTRLKVLAVPPFAESEVSDVLRAYGATQEDAGKWSSSVCTLSSGHPALVAAVARHLRNLEWKMSSLEQFKSLFVSQDYAVEINNDTTRRLIDTVGDSDSRELLYRLNLAIFGFDIEDVKVVSSVRPSVSRPVERLTLLDGLWIQRTSQDTYTVSPLIRKLGHDDIPSERRRAIHYLLSTKILSKRTLDIWDASHVVTYFRSARFYQNALVILSQALHVLSEQEVLNDDAFLGLFWSTDPLPSESSLPLRIFVRSLQINVNRKLGRDVTFAVIDLGNLIDSAQADNGWSLPAAAIELARHSELYIEHWGLVHKVIAKAISLFPEVITPDGNKLTSMIHIDMEALIWLVTPNISTVDQLCDWARMLETLSPEALQKAFSIPDVDQCCFEILYRFWVEEGKKDEDSCHWAEVLDSFDEVGARVKALGLHFLWACVNRARMIIHAEYLDDLDAAQEIAEKTMAVGAEYPKIQVLMKEYIGQQYYWQRRSEIARSWLEGAIEQETGLNPFGRLRSLVYLSAIVGEKDSKRALGLMLEAVDLANKRMGISELDEAKVLSELAVAKWLLTNDISAAFDSFDEAAERLFSCQQDTVFWKAQFVLFATVTVYLDSIASGGEPPVVDGQPYDRPFIGMFFRGMEEKFAERFQERTVWACVATLASFASATRNDERAVYWAVRGLDMARSRGQSHAIGLLIKDLVPHLLINNEYAEVLDMAIESSSAGVATRKLAKDNKFSFEMSIDIPSVLGPKPSDLWSQAEQESALVGLLPTSFRILSVALDDMQFAKRHSEEVAAICRQISNTASYPDFWLLSSEIFSGSFSETTRGQDLVNKAKQAKEQGHDALAVVGYMFTSMKSDYHIKHRVLAQLAAMPYVHHVFSKHMPSIYRLIVLPFLSQYWTSKVRKGGILFSSPNIVEKSLREADDIPEAYRAQHILREVIGGLRIRMRKKDEPWLYEKPNSAKNLKK